MNSSSRRTTSFRNGGGHFSDGFSDNLDGFSDTLSSRSGRGGDGFSNDERQNAFSFQNELGDALPSPPRGSLDSHGNFPYHGFPYRRENHSVADADEYDAYGGTSRDVRRSTHERSSINQLDSRSALDAEMENANALLDAIRTGRLSESRAESESSHRSRSNSPARNREYRDSQSLYTSGDEGSYRSYQYQYE